METSPKQQDNHNPPSLLPSPNSHSSSSSNSNSSSTTNNGGLHNSQLPVPSPKSITRSDSANPYPTTFVQADTSSFKQVVQMLTGSPKPTVPTSATTTNQSDPSPKYYSHNIPPIKSIPKKNQSSGFKLYERRNSLKNLKINTLNSMFSQPGSGFSPRKPDIVSPSILDFPALVLSPVTPLIPDPFGRSGASNCYSPMKNHNINNSVNGNLPDADAEDKAIKEKGFFLHPSPASTPRDVEPRLLSLFPVTSPRVSGSAKSST